MSADLSNEANELVRAGQIALRPTAGDKQRVLAALQARLQHEPALEREASSPGQGGAGPEPHAPKNEGAPPPPNEATVERLKLMTLGKFALVAGGLIASYAVVAGYLSRAENETTAASSVAPSIVAPESPSGAAQGPATELAASGVTSLPSIESTAGATVGKGNIGRAPVGDNLAAEAAVLSRAEKALHAGDLNRALLLTSEHRSKFPKGLMAQERVNIQIQSLCGLGREAEADKIYARFRRLESVQPGQACRQK